MKRELKVGKSANQEHARDVASFAVDGGTLVIGIGEDKTTGTFFLAPQPLAGLSERVESIAATIPDPRLMVVPQPIPSGNDPSCGYLLVHVPVSPMRPHMVDGRYLGRGEKTKRYLTDADVARLHALRRESADEVQRLLEAEIARDLVTPEAAGQHSHLFLVAQPVAGRTDLLLPVLDADDWRSQLRRLLQAAHQPIANGQVRFAPDYDDASQLYPRAAGAAASSHHVGPGRVIRLTSERDIEEESIDVEFHHDGGIRVWMGRLSYRHHERGEVVLVAGALRHTRRLLALTAAVADATGYLGNWDFGFAATGLRGRHALRPNAFGDSPVYDVDRELRTTSATHAELTSRPGGITDRLVGHFLRTYAERGTFLDALTDPSSAAVDNNA